jgi:hypothetical protein
MSITLQFVVYLLALVALIVAAVLSRRAPAACLLAVGLALFVLVPVVNTGAQVF